jgi:hypothetical protein
MEDAILDVKNDTQPGEVLRITLRQDMEILQWCLEELEEEGIDVGPVVIDPIDRYIGAITDSPIPNKYGERNSENACHHKNLS